MKEEYTLLNPYYIQDSKGKKYNHTETCKLINHQNRIILMKTELIRKLVGTNDALTRTIQDLKKEKQQ